MPLGFGWPSIFHGHSPPPPPRRPAAASARSSQDEKRLEAEIEAAEAALRALEDELADPGAWSDPKRSADSTARHERAKRTVEELYARWEQVAAG